MKSPLLGFASALLAVIPAPADTITLTDGRTFAEARIISASAGRVCIRHTDGIAQVERSLLPPELATRYPADAQAVAAEDARRAADAEKKTAQEEARDERHRTLAERAHPAPKPQVASAAEIEDAVVEYAKRYFRDKYQSGSNDSVTFNVSVETEPPAEMSGWLDQWRVAGEASFTHYRSSGWGNYQKETRRFEAIVSAPAGERPRVKDFTLR
jgi:hypothetical protein